MTRTKFAQLTGKSKYQLIATLNRQQVGKFNEKPLTIKPLSFTAETRKHTQIGSGIDNERKTSHTYA